MPLSWRARFAYGQTFHPIADPVRCLDYCQALLVLTISVIGRCDSDAGLLEQGLGEGEHGGQRACEKARTDNLSASIHAACDQTGQAASRGMH